MIRRILVLFLAIATPLLFPNLLRAESVEYNGWHYELTSEVFVHPGLSLGERATEIYFNRKPRCADQPWYILRKTEIGPHETPYQYAGMATDEGPCGRRWLEPEWFGLAKPAQRCIVQIHENGHVFGFQHTEHASILDPWNVMADGKDFVPDGIPEPCYGYRNAKRLKDRIWCRKHQNTCRIKYPELLAVALPNKI